jgi:hypothetical protein
MSCESKSINTVTTLDKRGVEMKEIAPSSQIIKPTGG